MATTLEMARSAKPRAAEAFSRFGEVVGVGIVRAGDGYGLKVNLRTAPCGASDLPSNIDGVPTRVELVGTVRARTA